MDKAAFVSLTFDDGFRSQFDKALPVLNSYGMPATFFLIANQDPTHDRWAGHIRDWWKIDWCEGDIQLLKTLIRDGHEIGSHSVTHHPTKMQGQPEFEARESKQLIEGWIGTTVSSFCYPFYRSHGYLANAVKNAGYEQARGGGIPPSYGPRASYYTIPYDGSLDRFNVDCRQISNDENVGGWVRPGCWHILTFHGIGGNPDGWAPITVPEFTRQMAELAKHRDAGAVKVVTFKNGADRMRQPQ
jgi:peptidoglycan/xylan/chitin deacetylase (PgdA/CDA1 family)